MLRFFLILFAFAPSAASALPTVSVEWRDAGTFLAAPVSSTAILDVAVTADSAGLVGIGITVQFDASTLTYLSGQEFTRVDLPGMGNLFMPLGLGISTAAPGELRLFDQVSLATGLGVGQTATLGSFKFRLAAPTATSSCASPRPSPMTSSTAPRSPSPRRSPASRRRRSSPSRCRPAPTCRRPRWRSSTRPAGWARSAASARATSCASS